jgi:hypothetical protein
MDFVPAQNALAMLELEAGRIEQEVVDLLADVAGEQSVNVALREIIGLREASIATLETSLTTAGVELANALNDLEEAEARANGLAEELWLLQNPAWSMFNGTIFEGWRPRRVIDVYPGQSIHSACLQAHTVPGTLVAVHAGDYFEAIKLPSFSGGEPGKEIVIASVDGYQAARIRPPSGSNHCFQGLSVHDYAIVGFDLAGSRHGVHIARSLPEDPTVWLPEHISRNILIRHNYIRRTVTDGIKISQTDNAQVLDNDIEDCGEEGIDCVNVWGIEAGYNRIRNARTAGLIVAKAGSQGAYFHHNDLGGQTTKSRHGIAFGGWADTANSIRPDSPPHACTGGLAEGNRVELVDGYLIRGASCKSVEIRGNYLVPTVKKDANNVLLTAAHTMAMEPSVGSEGTPSRMLCEDVNIHDNHVLPGRNVLGLDGEQNLTRDRISYTAGTADLSVIVTGPRPFVGPPA